jgi:hemerythrin-like domain-containing protein
MPVRIGTAENTFTNPIGLMSDCHRRIERFLQALLRVTSDSDGGSLDAEHRSALAAALKYFREAAPKHTADEEEDLFPALRGRGPAVEELLERVHRLEQEHRIAADWHREVDEIGKRWLRQDHLSLRETAQLKKALASLSELYQAHIEIEEQEIFPLAQAELSDSEKTSIGRRMALRRGVPFVPEWARPGSDLEAGHKRR